MRMRVSYRWVHFDEIFVVEKDTNHDIHLEHDQHYSRSKCSTCVRFGSEGAQTDPDSSVDQPVEPRKGLALNVNNTRCGK